MGNSNSTSRGRNANFHCYSEGFHAGLTKTDNHNKTTTDRIHETARAVTCYKSPDTATSYQNGYNDGSKIGASLHNMTGVSAGDTIRESSFPVSSRNNGSSQKTMTIHSSHVSNGNTVLIPDSEIDNFMKQNNI